MDYFEIEEKIKRLEVELKESQKGFVLAESLNRLKDIAKVYSGEDKVISFEEIAERIKNQKDKKKIKNFQGDVLFSEETLASLLDNILSYNLSGENIFYNRSGFCNKINKKVF